MENNREQKERGPGVGRGQEKRKGTKLRLELFHTGMVKELEKE